MADIQQDKQQDMGANYEQQHTQIGFLPDLCSAGSVLSLVLVGELLSIALVLSAKGITGLEWQNFGLLSLLVQWILLMSAATLCPLRAILNKMPIFKAVVLSYALVMFYTGLFSAIGLKVAGIFEWSTLLTYVCVAAIFTGVLMRYLYLQKELKRREQSALEARVQALQSRIRPHFLFNSLNSIASLILIKPDAAEKMVLDLAHLFRGSLKLPQLTSIEQEITLCKCFIDIEKARLSERLNVEWLMEDGFDSQLSILNLVLQPLVENAIYHGIQPLPSGGIVYVELKKVAEDVVIKVTNPRLPGRENGSYTRESNGIALSNIRHRLVAFYGDSAYLRIVKGEADFSVVLRYPLTKPTS